MSLEDQIAEFEAFMEELPTVQCGEGGCDACSSAFIRSCGVVHVAPEFEADTAPAMRVGWDADTIPEMEWGPVLGGEG